jgi:hypothetical protein
MNNNPSLSNEVTLPRRPPLPCQRCADPCRAAASQVMEDVVKIVTMTDATPASSSTVQDAAKPQVRFWRSMDGMNCVGRFIPDPSPQTAEDRGAPICPARPLEAAMAECGPPFCGTREQRRQSASGRSRAASRWWTRRSTCSWAH